MNNFDFYIRVEGNKSDGIYCQHGIRMKEDLDRDVAEYAFFDELLDGVGDVFCITIQCAGNRFTICYDYEEGEPRADERSIIVSALNLYRKYRKAPREEQKIVEAYFASLKKDYIGVQVRPPLPDLTYDMIIKELLMSVVVRDETSYIEDVWGSFYKSIVPGDVFMDRFFSGNSLARQDLSDVNKELGFYMEDNYIFRTYEAYLRDKEEGIEYNKPSDEDPVFTELKDAIAEATRRVKELEEL